MNKLTALIEALTDLVELIGPINAMVFIGLIVLAFFGLVLYRDHRKDKERDMAIAIMERSVQNCANENRFFRIWFLKQQGWDDDQIERFVITEPFEGPRHSREELRNRGSQNDLQDED